MNDPASDVNAWEQLSLYPSDPVQITLRIGVLWHHDHCQFQVEAMDPATGRLLALWSLPHTALDRAEDGFDQAVAELRRALAFHTSPFPPSDGTI